MVSALGWSWRAARRVWSQARARAGWPPRQELFVHDPAAAGPHDLDDPFFDSKVQERVAKVIAASARNQRDKAGP